MKRVLLLILFTFFIFAGTSYAKRIEQFDTLSDNCKIWALGMDYKSILIKDVDYTWNLRHKNIFEAYPQMVIQDFVNKVSDACKEYNK